MFSRLFGLYRRSPFWARELLSRATWPLRLALKPMREIRIGGYSMTLDFFDNASFKYLADRENYEREEVRAFLACLVHNPGCWVVDVGANYGAFALPAAMFAQWGLVERVVAIEPDRRPFKALRRSLVRNGWSELADVHQLILGDKEGRETIFVNARSSADNRTHQVGAARIRTRERYEVGCATLDRLLGDDHGDRRYVVKMDIQGNEPRALRGMIGTLQQASGWILFFEHAPYLIESAGEDARAHERLLASLAPERVFEFGEGDRLEELAGIAGWHDSLARLRATSTRRLQGVGSNYAFVRGLSAAGFMRRDPAA